MRKLGITSLWSAVDDAARYYEFMSAVDETDVTMFFMSAVHETSVTCL